MGGDTMLIALALSALFAADGRTYVIEWQAQKDHPEQIVLADGQAYKRVQKLKKNHLRTVFSLRATGIADGRVRLEADFYQGATPVHVALDAKLDRVARLRLGQGKNVRVKVHKIPVEVASTSYSFVTDLP
jgi:hypothetical protein